VGKYHDFEQQAQALFVATQVAQHRE